MILYSVSESFSFFSLCNTHTQTNMFLIIYYYIAKACYKKTLQNTEQLSHFQNDFTCSFAIHRDKSLRPRIRSWRMTWTSWGKHCPTRPPKIARPMSSRTDTACCWINSKRPMMSWKCAKRKSSCSRPRLSTPRGSWRTPFTLWVWKHHPLSADIVMLMCLYWALAWIWDQSTSRWSYYE